MKEIYKPIHRFPMVYRMQAQKAIDYAVRDTVRVTADAFIMAMELHKECLLYKMLNKKWEDKG